MSARSSSGHTRSAHRFAIFVKICIADAPIALPRGGASWVPPAIETCAPSSRASSQTGAIHDGSFALSFFGLNAGRFAARTATGFVGWIFCLLRALGGLRADFSWLFFADLFAALGGDFLTRALPTCHETISRSEGSELAPTSASA